LIRALALHPMERLNFGISAGAIAVSLAVAPPSFSLSLALGVALEAVNFRALRVSASRLFTGEPRGSRAWTALFAMRLTLLLASMALALAAGAHPIGLLAGVSTIVPAALIGAWLMRPPIDPAAPSLPPDDPSWDLYSVWRAAERDPIGEEDA
jgi:hypothetical protein